jgi:flagellar biosynthesis protein FlhG
VLVIDENVGANVSRRLGLRLRGDLRDAIEGGCGVREVLAEARPGVAVLAASDAVRALRRLDTQGEKRAVSCFSELDKTADIVLLDTRSEAREASPFAHAAQEVIVVVSPGRSSITGGYAVVKRMSGMQRRERFRLLVNRARDEVTADRVRANMARVARQHLDVAVEYLGAIPDDAAVTASAREFLSVVDAAPAAAASRGFSELGAAMLRWSAPQNDSSRLDNFMQRAIYGSRVIAAGAGV